MKIALMCMAKDEDHYLEEWILYHLKLGFDDIIIYQNDYRSNISHPNLKKYIFDGSAVQIHAHNHFLNSNANNYDWVAFFDVDEYLVLKKHKNIKDFVKEYINFNAIAINWVLFGDNGIEKINNNYSLIKRFTKRENKINIHVKTILKCNSNSIMYIHNPLCNWIDTNKNIGNGPFNHNGSIEIAQLNHYFCKTREEFEIKINKGRSDINEKREMSHFEIHNFNEIEDFFAYNFMYNEKNLNV
jgi:hypothetical protein